MNEKTVKHLSTVWTNMKSRCNNPQNLHYGDYGGRGIKVCKRWDKRLNFIKDMGPSYKKRLQIERIDNNKGYSPRNCRWATTVEQARNKRNNHNITFNGETKSMAEWADALNMSYSALICRINKYNWDIKKAFTIPVKHHPPRKIKWNGKTLSAAEWSQITGVPASTIIYRHNKKLPTDDVFKKANRGKPTIKDHPVAFCGQTLNISEWAKELDIPYTTLLSRFKNNWPVGKALNKYPFKKH